MGTHVYNFLTESLLWSDTHIDAEFSSVSESELRKELDRYRAFCHEHASRIAGELPSDASLTMFSGPDRVEVEQLKQHALYVETYVVADPIYPHTFASSGAAAIAAEALGLGKRGIDRASLAHGLRYLRTITPMVAANYVKVLPTRLSLRTPVGATPIGVATHYPVDPLPHPIEEFFRERATVRSLQKTDDGWRVAEEDENSRGLAIRFDPDNPVYRIYHLFDALPPESSPDDKTLLALLPDTPPDKDLRASWVTRSLHQAATDELHRVIDALTVATQLKAALLTQSRFERDLLCVTGIPEMPASQATQYALNLDLPFLHGVSVSDLMKVRTQEDAAFKEFRDDLERRITSIRAAGQDEGIASQVDAAIHELTEIEVRKVERSIRSARSRAFRDSAVWLATLGASFPSVGALATSIIALVSGYRTVDEYKRAVKKNPAFFLWKVKGKSKHR